MALNETVAQASLTSYKALDVVGFTQFKQKYAQWMEERAISNPGRITKEEFLIEIKSPATIEPTSPVKAVLATFQAQLEWPSQKPPVLEVDLLPPGPISCQTPPLPSHLPESHENNASDDIQTQLLVTRAAFLADRSLPSSAHQVPQLVMPALHPLPFPSKPPILPAS